MSDTPTPDTPAPAKKSKKKLVAGALAAVLLASAGGAGAWWYTGRASAGGAQPPKPVPTTFVNLDAFTVNLKDPAGDRFAQVGITLEIDDPKAEARIKDRLPAVRNNILLLVSGKQIDELLAPEGKQQLAQEVRDQVGVALGLPAAAPAQPASAPAPAKDAPRNPVRNVLFSQFIVQ